MGYKSGFNDNGTYNSNDINEIYQRMFGAGVIALNLQDYVNYQNNKVNVITSGVLQKGVVPSTEQSLKVVKSGSNIKICEGMAFFNDGSYFIVDSAGVTLTPTSGVTNYVYLKRDSVVNGSTPYCSAAAPSGDYVLLAQFDSVDSITDKRTYCQGKIPMYSGNINTNPKYTIAESSAVSSLTFNFGDDIKHIIIRSTGSNFVDEGHTYRAITDGAYDVLNNTYSSNLLYSNYSRAYQVWNKTDGLYVTGSESVSIAKVTVTKSGTYFTFHFSYDYGFAPTFDIYLCR